MDIDLHEARVPNVGETVHFAGFHDEDRTRADLELLAFDHVSRARPSRTNRISSSG
jgi:hypothetical protein